MHKRRKGPLQDSYCIYNNKFPSLKSTKPHNNFVFVFVETGSECVNSEPVSVSPETEKSNKIEEKKAQEKKKEVAPTVEQDSEVSEVLKTLRKRREDMAAKHIIHPVDEKKLKEEEER